MSAVDVGFDFAAACDDCHSSSDSESYTGARLPPGPPPPDRDGSNTTAPASTSVGLATGLEPASSEAAVASDDDAPLEPNDRADLPPQLGLAPGSLQSFPVEDESEDALLASTSYDGLSPGRGNLANAQPDELDTLEGDNCSRSPSEIPKFHIGPHPVHSCEQLMEAIPALDQSSLKRLVKPSKVTQVLVLGATGRIGSLLVKYLALQHEAPGLIIHCVVRANNAEAGKTRVEAAIAPLASDEAQKDLILGKTRVWTGDVTFPGLGLEEEDFAKLAARVEAIYVAVAYSNMGDLNDWSNLASDATGGKATNSLYTDSAEVTVHSWSNVFMLASKGRQKYIYAFTSLIHLSEFLQPRSTDASDVKVVEGQIDSLLELNRCNLSPHSNVIGCGAWCNGAIEAILKYAKLELNYHVTIFRLPPYVFTDSFDNTHVDLIRRRPPVAWKMLHAIIQEGLLPDLPPYLYALYCQPIDLAVRDAITLSFGNRRIYWVYHVFDERIQRQLTHTSFLGVLKRVGLYPKLCSWADFVEAVHSRGPASHLAMMINDLDAVACRLCEGYASGRKVVVSTTHLQHDLQMNHEESTITPSNWEPWRSYGVRAVRSLLHESYFAENSRGTLRSWEELVSEAKICSGGLTDLGEDGILAEEGWRRFLGELDAMEKTPVRFFARCAAARTAVVYLTNLLYMREREKKCPEILEQVIKSPTFIVGLNRAGTTFTHQLLAQDTKHNRCPVLLEMLFPYGENGDYRPIGLKDNDAETWARDPRRKPADDVVRLQTGGPHMKNFGIMHHRDSTSYEEDLVVFEMLGRSYSLCAGYNLPRVFDWLMADDGAAIRKAYGFHKRFFQHLEYQRPKKRWIFKLPWHLLTIESLFETYPDAELIFLHRRPVSALTSWVALEMMMQNAYLQKIDATRIGPRGLEVMSKMMDKAMDYQDKLALRFVQNHPSLQPPQSFFLNVYFDELIETPVAVLAEIYEALDWGPICSVAERTLWNYLEAAQKMRGSVKLPTCELADVGLSKGEARARFSRYSDAYFDPAQRVRRKNEIKIARAIRYNSLDKEVFYTDQGTIATDSAGAWIDPQRLEGPRRSWQQMLSYARSKLAMAE